MISRWSPPAISAPVGSYSHLAAVPPDHEVVFVAGQLGVAPDGTLAGPDAQAQARQALANVEVLLGTLGATPRQLVKLFTMVAGVEHLPGVRAAVKEVFARWFPGSDWPAQSLVVVVALAAPQYVVEIEAVVAVPQALRSDGIADTD